MLKTISLLILSVVFGGCVTGTVKDTTSTAVINTVCVEGHVYYETSNAYGSGLAPKLTDDGKPVFCNCGNK